MKIAYISIESNYRYESVHTIKKQHKFSQCVKIK